MASNIVLLGKVFTADAGHPYAGGVAVEGGRIAYVGDRAGARELVGEGAKVVDAGEGLILPGFVDGHMHYSQAAYKDMFQADLMSATTVAGYARIMSDFIAEHPHRSVYVGVGWDNAVFEREGARPDRSLLDAVCPDVPCAIRSYDAHSFLVNTAALEKAGIGNGYVSARVGEAVLDDDGNPTGLFREWAADDVVGAILHPTRDEFERALDALQGKLFSLGITQIYEPVIDDGDKVRPAYQALDLAGRLKLKVTSGFKCLPELYGADQVEQWALQRDVWEGRGRHYAMGNVKFFMDGVVESRTGWLFDDYADEPGYRGEPNCTLGEFETQARAAAEAGLQIHIHAIGDAALDMALSGLEYARRFAVDADWRPTITHLQVVRPRDIERMARLGVIANTDPAWHMKEPAYFENLALPYLGAERADRQYPLKSLWDAGVTVSTGTDFPVTDPNPMLGIEAGVTRSMPGDASGRTALWPEEGVSVERMLASYTVNGAYQNRREATTGSIVVGKCADIAVLDRDITAIDPSAIHEAHCVLTLADGRVVHEA